MHSKSDQQNEADRTAAIPVELSSPRATSYDVARLAGVSQSAVSRAFREGTPVSAEMRAKIQAAARQLGYAPSQIARSLITQRSRMIGVVTTDLSIRNYPELLFHLGSGIQASDCRMLVFTVAREADAGAAVADLLAYHVDGLISSVDLPEEALASLDRHAVPVVLYNRRPRGPFASAVGCDGFAGMELLAGDLAAAGVRRAVYLAGPAGAPVSDERLLTARAALGAKGIEIERVAHGDYSYESGRALARSELAMPGQFRAVICANDATALGAMDTCRFDLGLRIPDDIAVTGFDDVPQAAWPTYELTTLRQPIRRMTHTAVRLLTERIAGDALGGERRLLEAELRRRKSTPPAVPNTGPSQ